MAKVFGVSWTVILIVSVFLSLPVSFYLAVQLVLGQNTKPAILVGYPKGGNIADAIDSAQNQSGSLFTPPLRTRGRYIIDGDDRRFKLVSINWYGASDVLYIPGGLDVRHRDDIAWTIRRLGFNSVRLPYSDEMVRKNPLISQELLAANVDLVGLRALDVFTAVANSLTEAGIAVIVNNHITQARWCCDGNPCDGQWSNSYLGLFCSVRQTEEEWIENWETIMRPLIQNPLIVGVDLRNEIRGLLGRYMWDGWATAAEKAAERLLNLQPNWLIVVEGVSSANDISGARNRPIELSVADKLVYSAHVYGWSGWGSLRPYAGRKYESFKQDMHHNWAFLLENNKAPVWIGEFGAPNNPSEGDLHYWQNLIRYLNSTDADFGYWAFNPRKPMDGERESYSLVEDDWKTPILDYRISDILKLAQYSRHPGWD
jgi:endoglucanase